MFSPYLYLVRLFCFLRRLASGEESYSEICDGVYVGGWPYAAGKLPPGNPAIVHCTCEFPRLKEFKGCSYLCVPTWDTRSPQPADIESAVKWAVRKRAQNRPVFVHCAYGCGLGVSISLIVLAFVLWYWRSFLHCRSLVLRESIKRVLHSYSQTISFLGFRSPEKHVDDTSWPESLSNTRPCIITTLNVRQLKRMADDRNPSDEDQFPPEEEEPILFDQEDVQDAVERTHRSLVLRIFWDNPRPRLTVQRILNNQWNGDGNIRVFDAGYGLFQVLFPSIGKKNSILQNQPWNLENSLMHLADYDGGDPPSPELFDKFAFMNIWVKLTRIPFEFQTISFGRKMLASLGLVHEVGYYENHNEDGLFLKGFVRINVLRPFLGRRQAKGDDGRIFWVYFHYERLPVLCYRCGLLGHHQNSCPHMHIRLNPDSRGSWMTIPRSGRRLDIDLSRPRRDQNFRNNSQFRPPPVSPAFKAPPINPPRSAGQARSNLAGIEASEKAIPPTMASAHARGELDLALPKQPSKQSKGDVGAVNRSGADQKRTLAAIKGKAKATVKAKKPKPTQQASGGIIFKEPSGVIAPEEDSDSGEDVPLISLLRNPPLLVGEGSGSGGTAKIDEFGSFLSKEEEDEDANLKKSEEIPKAP